MENCTRGDLLHYMVLSEVPNYLKEFAKRIVRLFYQLECVIVIDTLVFYSCLKESDLEKITKFDKKLLQDCLSDLQKDKFVKSGSKMENVRDGEPKKVVFYYIDYRTLVNVVKCKLHIICETKWKECVSSFQEWSKTKGLLLPKKYESANETLKSISHIFRKIDGKILDPKLLSPQPAEIFSKLCNEKLNIKQEENKTKRKTVTNKRKVVLCENIKKTKSTKRITGLPILFTSGKVKPCSTLPKTESVTDIKVPEETSLTEIQEMLLRYEDRKVPNDKYVSISKKCQSVEVNDAELEDENKKKFKKYIAPLQKFNDTLMPVGDKFIKFQDIKEESMKLMSPKQKQHYFEFFEEFSSRFNFYFN